MFRLAQISTPSLFSFFFTALIISLTSCYSISYSPSQSPFSEQEDPIEEEEPEFVLDDISVTATRSERRTFDTPRAITVVDKKEVKRKNQLSIVDALNDKIGVWVEKRTTTTSDPVIRGFAGGNLLALIDGNSLTSLWGEGGFAGDDMYGKIDGEAIERIEVIRGPSSVLYGSNALGGVLNFITKSSPIDYTESGYEMGGMTKISYGSAADETRVRQEFYGAGPRLKFFLGGTSHKVHDVEGGRGVGTQSPTGGRDYAWDFKGQYLLTDNQEIEVAIQDIHRHKVRRFYRPNQTNFNDREALTLTWKATDINDYMKEFKIWGFYQDKEDMRRDDGNAKTGKSRTETYALDFQNTALAGDNHRLTYGMHYHEDHGESPDDEQFTWTDWATNTTQKPSPDSTWADWGLYIQDEWDLCDDLTLISSGRYDRFRFSSNVDSEYVAYIQDPANNIAPGFDPYLDEYGDTQGALSGGLGMLYRMNPNINLIANYAHGYRLFGPKFGLTEHGGFGYLAPHPFLDPVESDTYEVGTKALYEKFAASFFAYYSAIRNWQTNTPGTYNGLDYFDANTNGIKDSGEQIFVTSSGKANVYGVELETETRLDLLHSQLPSTWSLAAGFGWNFGDDRANDEPIRHTQPARGLLALKWKDEDRVRNGWFEFSADMVRRYDRIPSGRLANDVGYKSDPQNSGSSLLRDYGLPGYTVYTVRGGLDLMENLSLTVAVENLSDKKYRGAHSRWDAPGINFVTSLAYRF